ncbi:ULP1 like protease [Cryptosporidium canis]|uniref:ULP1 like protease n=1 Tax=Cryptosporidium canis TaxID=195482 RepID=A0A9D5DMQ8_9CRYT|nr:ULP1 like protease [Cryptosporidium canis]
MSTVSTNGPRMNKKSINLNGICLCLDKALAQLRENSYLDDLILDFFMEFTKESCIGVGQDGSGGKYCVLSSLFYTILSMCGDNDEEYIRLRRWVKRISTPLLLSDAIVIPMHCSQTNHWWLIVICHPCRVFRLIQYSQRKISPSHNIEASNRGWIVCMDSLGGKNIGQQEKKRAIENILKFLDVERRSNEVYSGMLERKYEHLSSSADFGSSNASIAVGTANAGDQASEIFRALASWEIVYSPRNLPFQENNFDCGIYIIEYVHRLFHDGTRMFNSMVGGIAPLGESGSANLQQNWFSKKWFKNRRAVYTRVLEFMSTNADWSEDQFLKSRLVEIFDDNVTALGSTKRTEAERLPSLQTRRKFVMSSLNKNYFSTSRS